MLCYKLSLIPAVPRARVLKIFQIHNNTRTSCSVQISKIITACHCLSRIIENIILTISVKWRSLFVKRLSHLCTWIYISVQVCRMVNVMKRREIHRYRVQR